MTKTTNYEISKKLAEIGFKAEAEKCWAKIRHSVSSEFNLVNLDFAVPQNCDEWVLSYDLETLLEFAFNISDFKIYYNHVFIADYWNDGKYEVIDELLVDRERSFKSVNGKVIREYKYNYAEIVAKLIILLHEKNLIKF
jgi:hypothetical protein